MTWRVPLPLPGQAERGLRRSGSALAGDDVGIDDIAVEVRDLGRGEARLAEHLPSGLLSPHGAQAHSAVGEGDGHAVHARYRVQERPERVVQILRELAGGGGID